ncbi:ferredoxin [Brevibacillus sp. GCM10020057]|uniref:(2Fe-2S) ferredoxin domain-containing protein n=1 Tax=Brevibacillus sp. GCM10020057 TaxID=3317327 RepID=UPI00362ECA41
MATWDLTKTKHHVLLCNGGSCNRKGGEELTVAIRSAIAEAGLDDQVHTTRTRCNGRCEDAPVMIVYPEGTWYGKLTPELAPHLVEQHFCKGLPVTELVTHRYGQECFVREEGVAPGILKSEKAGK